MMTSVTRSKLALKEGRLRSRENAGEMMVT